MLKFLNKLFGVLLKLADNATAVRSLLEDLGIVLKTIFNKKLLKSLAKIATEKSRFFLEVMAKMAKIAVKTIKKGVYVMRATKAIIQDIFKTKKDEKLCNIETTSNNDINFDEELKDYEKVPHKIEKDAWYNKTLKPSYGVELNRRFSNGDEIDFEDNNKIKDIESNKIQRAKENSKVIKEKSNNEIKEYLSKNKLRLQRN